MAECTQEKLAKTCSCTYNACPRKGKCCECVSYHRRNGEFPGCFFTKEGEKIYDRSWEALKKYHI